jgi:hypothetical protein
MTNPDAAADSTTKRTPDKGKNRSKSTRKPPPPPTKPAKVDATDPPADAVPSPEKKT